MAFSHEKELEAKWLPTRRIAGEMEWLSHGFSMTADELGSSWIARERSRLLPRRSMRCISSACYVAMIGWMLSETKHTHDIERLKAKIAKHDRSAILELHGLHLLLRLSPGAEVEYAPAGRNAANQRYADARVRWAGGNWTYAEIAARHETEREQRSLQAIKEVSEAAGAIVSPGVNTHVRLKRIPAMLELEAIQHGCRTGRVGDIVRYDLPNDLGDIVLDGTSPGRMQLSTRRGDQEVEGAEVAAPLDVTGPGLIVVSIEDTDHLIEKVVRDEASQLPKDSPSIVLVHRACGTRTAATWLNRLRRYFARNCVAHPSGAWLFEYDCSRVPAQGSDWYSVTGICNPNAGSNLPVEISVGMRRLAEPYTEAWADKHPDEL